MKQLKYYILTVALVLSLLAKAFGGNGYALVSGTVDFLKDGDKVFLWTYPYGGPSTFVGYRGMDSLVVKNHSFHFKIAVDSEPLQIRLILRPGNLDPSMINAYSRGSIEYVYVESGDNIVITGGRNGYVFSGPGSSKFAISNFFYQQWNSFADRMIGNQARLNKPWVYRQRDSIEFQNLRYLEANRQYLSLNAYTLVKANLLGELIGGQGLFDLYRFPDSSIVARIKGLGEYRPAKIRTLVDTAVFNESAVLQYSQGYANGIILAYMNDSCYFVHKPFLVRNCYKYLITHYHGLLKERLVTELLYNYHGKMLRDREDIAEYISDALIWIRQPDFYDILKKLKSDIMEGAAAYNFCLPDAQGKMHTLDEYAGKMVLIDFWFTGCENCIEVAPYLKKIEQHFSGKPVVFLSINMDNSGAQWFNGIKGGKYSSEYAVNLFTLGLGMKHPIIEFYNVDSGPTLIMIDKKGKLMPEPVDPRRDDGKNIISLIEQQL